VSAYSILDDLTFWSPFAGDSVLVSKDVSNAIPFACQTGNKSFTYLVQERDISREDNTWGTVLYRYATNFEILAIDSREGGAESTSGDGIRGDTPQPLPAETNPYTGVGVGDVAGMIVDPEGVIS